MTVSTMSSCLGMYLQLLIAIVVLWLFSSYLLIDAILVSVFGLNLNCYDNYFSESANFLVSTYC